LEEQAIAALGSDPPTLRRSVLFLAGRTFGDLDVQRRGVE
jgi:hypothetical protein